MNYRFTKKEKDIIKNSLGTLTQFSSLIDSYKELYNESHLIEFNLDYTDFSTYGRVAGILVSIKEVKDLFIVDMIIKGIRRSLVISNIYNNDLRFVQESLFESNDPYWTYEEIATYAFMLNKIFIINVKDNIIKYMVPASNPEMLLPLVDRYL